MQDQPTPLRPPADPKVDIGALAADLAHTAADRIATLIVRTIDSLAEESEARDVPGVELNHPQKVELVRCALQEFDGLELEYAAHLKDVLERGGVHVWGLTDEHERYIGHAS